MQHECVFDSVTVFFIAMWKFLAYVLNETHRFVMCIISYADVVYFICV
jgi:hypothetical protein